MTFQDLFVTPFFLLILFVVVLAMRPRLTNPFTKKYYLYGFALRIGGSIAFGLIYQFYYGGGDTFNYFKQSTVLYELFFNEPGIALSILFTDGANNPEYAQYLPGVYWYKAPREFFIIKVAAFLGLFCFNTYTVIGLFFACFSFSGSWAMYITFLKLYPRLYKPIGIAVFFVPSIFFWGSGLMKDSLTLGGVGWLFWAFYTVLVEKRKVVSGTVVILLAIALIRATKPYIVYAFAPAAGLWVFNQNVQFIRSKAVRMLIRPLVLVIGGGASVFLLQLLSEGDQLFALDKVSERTAISANYLYGVSVLQDGSGYTLGELDGSWQSMVRLFPQAVNVTLFRPYLWEVKNVVMLLSAAESFLFLIFTLRVFFRRSPIRFIGAIAANPMVSFCIIFSIFFSFAVGISSYNFGSLVRYKIPMIPFYLTALMVLYYQSKTPTRKRKEIEV